MFEIIVFVLQENAVVKYNILNIAIKASIIIIKQLKASIFFSNVLRSVEGKKEISARHIRAPVAKNISLTLTIIYLADIAKTVTTS